MIEVKKLIEMDKITQQICDDAIAIFKYIDENQNADTCKCSIPLTLKVLEIKYKLIGDNKNEKKI